MFSNFEYSLEALNDIQRIAVFLLQRLQDEEVVNNIIAQLDAAIEDFVNKDLVKGREIQGLPSQFREWVVLDGRYRVYFSRSTTGFDVWRVRFKYQPLLTPTEIVSQ